MSLLPNVFRPIKITDQLVSFPVSPVINSAALHLLGAELVESGTRMSTQSPVMVCIKFHSHFLLLFCCLSSVIVFVVVLKALVRGR